MSAKPKRIPWLQPKVERGDYASVKRALDANFVNEGPLTREFEEKIRALVGAKYAAATTSCTTGMFLALKALGIGHGDEVIVPDITFIATAHAVDQAGAKPILVDIDPVTLNIDPNALERAITNKTRAIIPVHVTGRAADMGRIMRIAKKHRLAVVEDAAEALTSKYKGRYLGTIGDIGCFSFSPNKIITTGQGGVLVTNSKKLYEELKRLKDQGRPVRGTGGDDIHFSIGYNCRITDLQAGLGLGQLQHLARRTKRLRQNYALYKKLLTGVGDIRIFPSAKGELPLWTDIETKYRDELAAYLLSKNIDSRRYWLPIHRQKAFRKSDRGFKESTRMSKRSLWLPSAFTMTDGDVRRVSGEIRRFFEGKK